MDTDHFDGWVTLLASLRKKVPCKGIAGVTSMLDCIGLDGPALMQGNKKVAGEITRGVSLQTPAVHPLKSLSVPGALQQVGWMPTYSHRGRPLVYTKGQWNIAYLAYTDCFS